MARILTTAFATATLASTALAHPGHGEAGEAFSFSPWHYLAEPEHAVVSAAAVAVLAIAGRLCRRRRGYRR